LRLQADLSGARAVDFYSGQAKCERAEGKLGDVVPALDVK
jgi:hypothetical protein